MRLILTAGNRVLIDLQLLEADDEPEDEDSTPMPVGFAALDLDPDR